MDSRRAPHHHHRDVESRAREIIDEYMDEHRELAALARGFYVQYFLPHQVPGHTPDRHDVRIAHDSRGRRATLRAFLNLAALRGASLIIPFVREGDAAFPLPVLDLTLSRQ